MQECPCTSIMIIISNLLLPKAYDFIAQEKPLWFTSQDINHGNRSCVPGDAFPLPEALPVWEFQLELADGRDELKQFEDWCSVV